MREIKQLVKAMRMEIKAADCYYHQALELKEEYPQVASVYVEIANQELTHCEKFHTQATYLINKEKAKGKVVPEAMQAAWDLEHELIMDDFNEVKFKLKDLNI